MINTQKISVSTPPSYKNLPIEEWEEFDKKVKGISWFKIKSWDYLSGNRIKLSEVEQMAADVVREVATLGPSRRKDISDFEWHDKTGEAGVAAWRDDVSDLIMKILRESKEHRDRELETARRHNYPESEVQHSGISTSVLLNDILSNRGRQPRDWRRDETSKRVMSVLDGLLRRRLVEREMIDGKVMWFIRET